ncbi:hypothetical protein ACEPAF_6604 [Sanghuangporus sanghuang]
MLEEPLGSGSGSSLPVPVLVLSGICTAIAVFISSTSIFLHLKNYRKPMLQRMVIRIMVMVPVYAIASLISLFSLNAAFVIDAIRDIYEAFVIYCFFNLLLGYLGGERSLLILLHGREPKRAVFPISLVKKEMDVSDPYVFLFLKRGIIQYVEVKPMLAAATLILKAVGKYNEGTFRANSGYLYVSIVYNVSICLSLYCLAVFWMVVNDDLKPFRPMPKFLCVKGILFFSFWQSIFISLLVSVGAIRRLGPYADEEHISLGLTDTLICFEMPLFAIAHMYAFSHTDYIDRNLMYAARMPMYYAFRDAFGLKDVIEDAKATLRGEGMDYREFEPAEGFIHQGSGRDRRIKAGLRYAQGGQKKYWLPIPADVTERDGTSSRAIRSIGGDEDDQDVYAPLMEDQAASVVHEAPNMRSVAQEKLMTERRGFELPFGEPDAEEDVLYEQSRSYIFGDYMYPCIDASSEIARMVMWEEEERVLRDERNAYFSPLRSSTNLLPGEKRSRGYGATRGGPALASRHSSASTSSRSSLAKGKGKDRRGVGQDAVASWSNDDRLVDKADLLVSPPEDGVRLSWTKYVRSPNASSSPYLRQPHSSLPSSERSAPASPRWRKKLPTDAVDLMVENEPAAVEEMTHERRHGEPAMRGSGWRKAFTQGRFVPDDKVEQENLEDANGIEPTSEVVEHPERWHEDTLVEVADEGVARAATPPPHAQFAMPHSPPHEENPWA